METIKFKLKGTAPALMQSERLANPLDSLTRQLKAVTGKRKKTDADHEEMARIEFLGGLYYDAKAGPFWPAQNLDRMFFDAAKLSKRGQDVKRGFMVVDDKIPVQYDGPRTPESMYAQPDKFVDVRSVVIQNKRTMRTRPIFREWAVEFEAAYDPEILNREDVIGFAKAAGRLIGLGTFRPRFGRFDVISAE